MTTKRELIKKNREMFVQLKRRAKRNYRSKFGLDYIILERAQLDQAIRDNTEDGMIAVIREGMDCDCTQYYSVSHIPAPKSIFAFQRNEDSRRESLDGPESMWIGKPSKYPKRYAYSDRALAAYEDGHMHSVTWASEDEMIER